MTTDARILCVGTHHKTGTSWMQGVFFNLGKALDIPVIRVPVPREWRQKVPAEGRVIVVNWRARFHASLLANDEARFFHLIRDPRDVLLSGAHYHETTDGKYEKFLYYPRDELGGKTYQEYIRSLPSREEKLAFEMGGKHAETMAQMRRWDYANPRSFEVRYEDLIVDDDCAIFSEALRFFGFSDDEVAIGAKVFHENSLFGEKGKELRARDHVKSGKPAQWISKLPRSVAELYLQRHGDDLIKLGYETDKGWLDRLGPAAKIAASGG